MGKILKLELKLGKIGHIQFSDDDPLVRALFFRAVGSPHLRDRFGLPVPGPEARDFICRLIDLCEDGSVFLYWEGEYVSNAKAKAWVAEYPERVGPLTEAEEDDITVEYRRRHIEMAGDLEGPPGPG
jgi:hypothetical protein